MNTHEGDSLQRSKYYFKTHSRAFLLIQNADSNAECVCSATNLFRRHDRRLTRVLFQIRATVTIAETVSL